MITNLWIKAQLAIEEFKKNEEGVTAIEYGLIAALISVVILTTVTTIGTSLNTKFDLIKSALA
ncbi:Flp family type IVb pilin [Vibrio splendidus]|uniref:Flp family type IVb pilin n=1 Tax=Vibrio splendidus TaxID=29497 RepID=UPI000C865CC1|nr:Flp family type IVb pilin [Vibrio splendidus]PMI52577.1 pilus assembly protein [Vibrio splendidus]PMI77951.1 pilus assembly protein [Vibrio splendidus]